MSINKASEDFLGELHKAVAEGLLEKLKSGEAKASDYMAAIRFLKDNNIDCDLSILPIGKDILDNIPTFEDGEEEIFLTSIKEGGV